MVVVPAASADVLNVATPPLSVPVPAGLPPSRNVTVPVGVPAPGDTGETVAVKVTDCPNTDGFADDVTAVAVSALTIVIFALPVFPVPAVVSETATLLFAAPICVPCTFTETVQLAPGARFAPNSDTDPEPALPVAVPVQVEFSPLGEATTNVPGAELGSVSVKEIELSVVF